VPELFLLHSDMKRWLTILLSLSYLYSEAQAGSEIFLFDMKIRDGQVFLSNGINITKHKGYDNQPFFHPSKPVIYYSSFDDSSRSDIKFYNYGTGLTTNLTLTREREYSPTVTPDGKFISCIVQRDNGAQDLAKFPVEGGKPEVLINDRKVGYHVWATSNKLLLFVLGDSNTNTLNYYNLRNKTDTILAKNIGRSLHKIPGENAISFIQRISEKESLVQRFDLVTGTITTIVSTLPGSDHLTWLQNKTILMSDGGKLFSCQPGIHKEWQPVFISGDTTMLKGVTRLAANITNTKLAVVVNE
jgi:hypothetical protein